MGRRLSTIHSRQRCASQLRRLIARRAASRSDSIKLITLTVVAVYDRRTPWPKIVGGHECRYRINIAPSRETGSFGHRHPTLVDWLKKIIAEKMDEIVSIKSR